MFTIEQIDAVHGRLGSAETLADYVRALAAIGVARYDSYVSDGHSEFVGHDAHRVVSSAVHDELTVAESSDREAFLDHLKRHERGETSYLEMCYRGGLLGWSRRSLAVPAARRRMCCRKPRRRASARWRRSGT